jgi:uncharacterized BrkB/YihY/UPF0761 family membrane protein
MKMTFGKIFALIFGISLVLSILINYKGILQLGTIPTVESPLQTGYFFNLLIIVAIGIAIIVIYKIFQNTQLRKIRRTPERF